MSSVKMVNISGTKVSFVPPVQSETTIDAPDEKLHRTPLIEPALSPQQALSMLSKDELSSLLNQHFAVEINERFEAAHAEGQKQGYEDIQSQLQGEQDQKLAELEQVIEAWRKASQTTIETNEWVISSQDDINAIVFKALCKLIGDSLTDAEASARMISNVVAQYSAFKPKLMKVSTFQFEQLESLKKLNLFGDEVHIAKDENLAPGSFRLELNSGSIEHDLDSSLQSLRQSFAQQEAE